MNINLICCFVLVADCGFAQNITNGSSVQSSAYVTNKYGATNGFTLTSAERIMTNDMCKLTEITSGEETNDRTRIFISLVSSNSKSQQYKVEHIQEKLFVASFQHNNVYHGFTGATTDSIIGVTDPYTKTSYLYLDQGQIYFSDGSDFIQIGFLDQSIYYYKSAFVESTNGMKAAISQCEAKIDSGKYTSEDFQESRKWISLKACTPRDYFGPRDDESDVVLGSVDMEGDLLKLAMKQYKTKTPAVFWIDMKSMKVVKSVVNGVEMDVNRPVITPQEVYALPLKK